MKERIASMTSQDYRDVAACVAEEVRHAGGRLRLAGSTLLELFVAERFDGETCKWIADAFAAHGLSTVPELRAGVRAGDQIDVRSTEYRPSRDGAASPAAASAAPPPSGPTPAAELASRVAA